MQTLAYLKARRMWFVRDFQVWGSSGESELFYLGVERVAGAARVMFGCSTAGENMQDVAFGNLIDARGNALPAVIQDPRVMVTRRSAYGAYVVGEESSVGFRIARDPSAPGAVSVDLVVIETGI